MFAQEVMLRGISEGLEESARIIVEMGADLRGESLEGSFCFHDDMERFLVVHGIREIIIPWTGGLHVSDYARPLVLIENAVNIAFVFMGLFSHHFIAAVKNDAATRIKVGFVQHERFPLLKGY